MKAKRAYRDRDETEVAVLDALVDRGEEGMTVLELRSSVDADIDTIESALTALKREDLIEVEEGDGNAIITPADRVVPSPDEDTEEPGILDRIRDILAP